MRKKSTKLYKTFKPIIKSFIKIFYNPKVEGIENIPKSGSVILAGNHKSNVDPLLVCTENSRIVHFLAKKELYKNIILQKFMDNVGTIQIDRDINDTSAIKESLRTLKKGEVIGIFPEGRRNINGDNILLPLKHGTVSLAQKTKSKLIPFAIVGNYKIFRSDVKLIFGKPLNIDNCSIEDGNIILEESIKKLIKKNTRDKE